MTLPWYLAQNMVLSWCMSKKTWYFDSTEWLPHSYLHDTWPKKTMVLSWNMSKKTWYFDNTEWLPHSYLHDTWPKKNMVLSWCMSKKTWYFDSTEWLPHSYLHDTWPKKNMVLSWCMSKKHGTLIVQNDYHIHIYMMHDQKKPWYYHDACLKKHGIIMMHV